MSRTPLRSPRTLLLAAVVSMGALALSGCSIIETIFPAQAERNSETNEVETAGEADVFQMQVGDCLNDQDATEVDSVPAVPCDEPHDYEVYYSFDLDAGEYPGDDAVYEDADQGCYDAFADFVGVTYEESALEFNNFVPTEGSWNELDDREIVCVVYDAEPVTGTLEGSAR